MYTSEHSFSTLFQQLGLPNSEKEINQFITTHRLYSNQIKLADASFWSPSQSDFLREAIDQDSEWAELVDELDTQLRQ
ncbi:DUF2789 domain-containing protein [Neptuniibacter halophilus]|uniref:DUF2789 domain-containing protein n=1 Tax=Neptuniibacter halophilus TaxID=651666 RepID=UPI00257433B9|nr:DUF2789 domain-containing protein [Neptuniibacter halophilus]